MSLPRVHLVLHMYNTAAMIVSLPGCFIAPHFHIYVFMGCHMYLMEMGVES